jgi:hypothetical protein
MNRIVTTIIAAGIVTFFASGLDAGTIIKVNFSTDSMPDIELVNGVLSTVDDAVDSTDGDQNSEVELLGVLAEQSVNVGDNASLTFDRIQMSGPPMTVGGMVLQSTQGGTFDLYDSSNQLLLSGTLGNGTLSGPLGNTATGGFLTTEFGTFTGGSLLPVLLALGPVVRSSFSVSMTDVNDGAGLSRNVDGLLDDFSADASAIIAAQPGSVPEPSGSSLLLLGASSWAVKKRRRLRE